MITDYKDYVKANLQFSKMTPEEKRAASKELAQLYIDNPVDVANKIVAATITRDVTRLYDESDLATMIGEVETFDPGDVITHKTVTGLVGAQTSLGGYAVRTKWSAEFTEIQPALLTVNPEANLTSLRGGRVGSLADLQAEAVKELRNLLMKTLWDTLGTSISGTTAGQDSDNYLEISSSNWTAAGSTAKTAINHAINRLNDNGGAFAIIGRVPAVAPITDIVESKATFSAAEYEKFGISTMYRNVPVISLPNNQDRAGTQRIDSNTVYVIGKGAVKTSYRGDIETYPGFDENTRTVNFAVFREYALTILDQTKIYKLNVNA